VGGADTATLLSATAGRYHRLPASISDRERHLSGELSAVVVIDRTSRVVSKETTRRLLLAQHWLLLFLLFFLFLRSLLMSLFFSLFSRVYRCLKIVGLFRWKEGLRRACRSSMPPLSIPKYLPDLFKVLAILSQREYVIVYF
jgi:hypothetical protein